LSLGFRPWTDQAMGSRRLPGWCNAPPPTHNARGSSTRSTAGCREGPWALPPCHGGPRAGIPPQCRHRRTACHGTSLAWLEHSETSAWSWFICLSSLSETRHGRGTARRTFTAARGVSVMNNSAIEDQLMLGVGESVFARLPTLDDQFTLGIAARDPVLVVRRVDREPDVLPADGVIVVPRPYGVVPT
jgi:hypothetical protein